MACDFAVGLWSPKRDMADTHRTGTAGQLAVAAILARRGYNVAIPMIDVGEDLLIRNDKTGKIWSIQVKTAKPRKPTRKHQRFQFGLRKDQLKDGPSHLWYVLVWPSKEPSGWGYFVIRRKTLMKFHRHRGAGSFNKKTGNITLNLSVPLPPTPAPKKPKAKKNGKIGRPPKVYFQLSKRCSQLNRWADNFKQWPALMP